jgi:AcrR family transcriptional regulator
MNKNTDLKEQRKLTASNARREIVLSAARTIFFEQGFEGASMREIAKQAGYTPGAIYHYFKSKEEVYAALLGESLARLNERVTFETSLSLSKPKSKSANKYEEQLRKGIRAFFDFYYENPRDLDLGFYLFKGMQPRGLTPELNKHLNNELQRSLFVAQSAIESMGATKKQALKEITACFAHIVGILLLNHTGRVKMFQQKTIELLDDYIDNLVARTQPTRKKNSKSS